MRQITPFLLAASLATGCTSLDDLDVGTRRAEARESTRLIVMTQNMYVGGDLDPIFTAAPEEVPFLVAEAFASLQATDIQARAAAMAMEIHDRHPHLVALQEVSHIQAPGVDIDFLAILLDALEAEGVSYRAVATIDNTDAVAPMITPSWELVPVRLTDADVILARDDVAVTTVAERNYAVELPLPIGIVVKRGYVAVDAEVDGETYRFVGTHLEDAILEAQMAQAAELIAFLADATGPTLVAGDLNSAAPSGASYQMFLGAGYVDAWTESPHGDDPGFTCCQAAALQNPTSNLRTRIDFILGRNLGDARLRARTAGDRAEDRTAAGLWPSDHAGLSAAIRR